MNEKVQSHLQTLVWKVYSVVDCWLIYSHLYKVTLYIKFSTCLFHKVRGFDIRETLL